MWAFFSALAGIVWGTGNISDKYLLDRYFKNVWHFLMVIETINFLVAIVLLSLDTPNWNALPWNKLITIATLNIAAVIAYIYALQREEVSRAVPLFITAMIMMPIADAIFLNNILTVQQYLAITLIAISSFALLWNRDKGLTHSAIVFILMLLSAAGFMSMWLLSSTIVEEVGATQYTGLIYTIRFSWVPMAILLYAIQQPKKIRPTAKMMRAYIKPSIIVIGLLTSLSGIFGMTFYIKALQFNNIPSLVEAISLIQYAYVFVMAFFLAKLFPGTFKEDIDTRTLVQKFFAIAGMMTGALLILFS